MRTSMPSPYQYTGCKKLSVGVSQKKRHISFEKIKHQRYREPTVVPLVVVFFKNVDF